jgi:hypothetical protein
MRQPQTSEYTSVYPKLPVTTIEADYAEFNQNSVLAEGAKNS